MKWSPQAIVATTLGIFLILLPTYKFTLSLAGMSDEAPEVVEMWISLMQVVAGGLIAYIGTRSEK